MKQGLECSQLKAVLEALPDTRGTCECRSPPGLQGGVWGTPGGVCAPRGPPGEDVQCDCDGWDQNLMPKRRHGTFCECV